MTMATRNALWRYRDEFGDAFGRTYFRRFGPGVASSVGLGTYRGAATAAVDDAARDVLQLGLESGVNHVDTAVNYRCGRAERVVGAALRDAAVDREAVVLASKGGFLPFAGERPTDPAAYIRERFVDAGLVEPADLAGAHTLAPRAIEWSLDRSLDRLGVETIDAYYVHAPETQLRVRSREAVYNRLEAVFEALERRRLAGDIGQYGVATWDALRVDRSADAYLSLREILARAVSAGRAVGPDDDHGFGVLQLPFTVTMADAFTRASQRLPSDPGGEPTSTLQFAHEADLSVVTSASLGGGDLTTAGSIPAGVDATLAGDTSAQRALNFARSAPAVRCSLVGTTDTDHLRENVAAGTFDPLGASAFDAVFA